MWRPAAVVIPATLPAWAMNPVVLWCESRRIPYVLSGDGARLEEDTVPAVWRVLIDDSTLPNPADPLVTVFTPTNGPASFLLRAYRSLREQSYTNWEWIVLENTVDSLSPTRRLFHQLTESDGRVHFVSTNHRIGVIGALKKEAALLGSGSILVELDHDDELTRDALRHLVDGLADNTDCGMAYSDWTELLDGVANRWYGSSFGFGFGWYERQHVDGREALVAIQPEINTHTVRHIVGMPNHLRAWRADFYHEIGGHNERLPVADDYEICVRSFLAAPMLHVHHCSYVQHFRSAGSNTHLTRNQAIQTAVAAIADRHETNIRSRLAALGLHDHVATSAETEDIAPTKANRDYFPERP